jgi:hypothetical protein
VDGAYRRPSAVRVPGNPNEHRISEGVLNRVAVAIDRLAWADVVGTLAGDDTIFLAVKDARAQRRVIGEVRKRGGPARRLPSDPPLPCGCGGREPGTDQHKAEDDRLKQRKRLRQEPLSLLGRELLNRELSGLYVQLNLVRGDLSCRSPRHCCVGGNDQTTGLVYTECNLYEAEAGGSRNSRRRRRR